jgi:hypothetical protein
LKVENQQTIWINKHLWDSSIEILFFLVKSLNPIVPTAAPLLDLEDTRSATAGPSRLPASKNAGKTIKDADFSNRNMNVTQRSGGLTHFEKRIFHEADFGI